MPDSGRVDVLLHAAGLEISHFLPDKPQTEYDLVFDVKVDGWFNLLHALRRRRDRERRGLQLDRRALRQRRPDRLLAANDLLCKSISSLRRGDGPAERGIAIDWTAWAEIGMASRGSIPKMMEMAGIDMLPPGIGVPVVRRELTAAGPGGEVLVAGSLGLLLAERHPTGGIDPAEATKLAPSPPGPMSGRIAAMTAGRGRAGARRPRSRAAGVPERPPDRRARRCSRA